jgi:hypothetical protein
MFNKVALLAFVAPLVAGLTLTIPQNPTSGGSITIEWTTVAGDPSTFSIELINVAFNNAFAIANNVPTASNQITLNLPIVPTGDGYTLEAVDIGNINNVYASTGSFSIGATVSTTSTGSAGTSTTATLTSPITTPSGTTTTGLGTAVSNTPTTSTRPSSGTTTSTVQSSPATTSNAAMAPLKVNSNVGAVAAVLFSAIAGAAIVAF